MSHRVLRRAELTAQFVSVFDHVTCLKDPSSPTSTVHFLGHTILLPSCCTAKVDFQVHGRRNFLQWREEGKHFQESSVLPPRPDRASYLLRQHLSEKLVRTVILPTISPCVSVPVCLCLCLCQWVSVSMSHSVLGHSVCLSVRVCVCVCA